MRILLIEDDPSLSRSLSELLRQDGFVVDVSRDGLDGLHLATTESYSVLLLDLGLPGLDGETILTAIRAARSNLPVLVLTARDRLADKARAFRAGADDYIVKPFAPEELVLRIHALVRRSGAHNALKIEIGALVLDTALNVFTLNGRTLDLTHLEAQILGHLMRNAGAVVSRTQISEAIYAYDRDPGFNTIEVIVSRLRKKIGPDMIATVRGGGYRLRGRDGPDAVA